MTFKINDLVRNKVDPRHVGEVRKLFTDGTVKVIWGESGWIEFVHHNKLERISDGHQYMLDRMGD